MLKKNKWMMLVTSLLILLPIAAGLILWEQLPEQLPIHWNAAGEVDGWCSKTQGVFLMPVVLLAVHWLCVLVTGQDPKNKDKNEKAKAILPDTSDARSAISWNQIELTTLVSAKRECTERALKVDPGKISSHDQTSLCSDGITNNLGCY